MESVPVGIWQLAPYPALLGVLVLLIVAVSRGWLIPKSSHDREISIYVSIVSNKDDTIAEQRTQITSLLEVGKTVQAVLKAAGPPVDETTRSV